MTRLPLLDAKQHIVGIIGIFRSVSDQKRSDEKIRDAVVRRDEFLAMLSHELRNPLGAIVSATALLKTSGSENGEGMASPLDARLLGLLERQSAQMARLLDELLEASRVTQDKIELRLRTLDLRSVARDAAEAVRDLMEKRYARPRGRSGDPATSSATSNLLECPFAGKRVARDHHSWRRPTPQHGGASRGHAGPRDTRRPSPRGIQCH